VLPDPSPSPRTSRETPLSLAVLALGGGTGHLFRAVAFARAAGSRGHVTRILASSAHTEEIARSLAPPSTTIAACRGSTDAMRAEARRWLDADDDALVVDTFPRGLVGELDELPRARPTVLVHRDLADAYALRRETREAAARFDAVVAPGEHGPLAAALEARWTAPWIVGASVTPLSRATARRAFGLAPDDAGPLVVVTVTADDRDAHDLADVATSLAAELAGRVHVRLARLGDRGAPLPLAPLLGGVDLVVGAAGYHLVHEARATATPLVARPAPRTYDVQARRLRPEERARDLDEVALRIRAAVPRTTTPPPSIEDGAAQGVALVEALIRARGRRPSR
jgi:hypothetical protein